MSIALSDIKFRKSAIVTDTTANGGVCSRNLVLSGVRHNLFPRVTKSERLAGLTRWRKEFFCNDNSSNETAYGSLFFFEIPSTAQDRFYLKDGGYSDTQADLSGNNKPLIGTGTLNTIVTAADTQVVIDMESDDFDFIPGGYLHITDKFATSQTIDTGVVIGDSVVWSSGLSKWIKTTQSDNIIYPNGILVGTTTVLTEQGSTNEEWLIIANNLYTDEDIGDGDGSTTNPALTTLLNVTNGICKQADKTPIVTAICDAITRTVNIDQNGICSGYCSAGQLNMDTGVWTTDITWTTAPDNSTDITITYRENPFTYSGNTVTVSLGEQVANSYSLGDTYVGGCISGGDVIPSSSDWSETSGSGDYDETTYPLLLDNEGTIEDSFTVTVDSGATTFACSGILAGSMIGGTVGTTYSPINPDTGTEYFMLSGDGWGNGWVSGDKLEFDTHPAQVPLWIKEVVPAGTPAEAYNLFVLGFYAE